MLKLDRFSWDSGRQTGRKKNPIVPIRINAARLVKTIPVFFIA
jgi:hypothetical protein